MSTRYWKITDVHKETPGYPGAPRNRKVLLILVLSFLIKPEEGIILVLSPCPGLTELVKTIGLGRGFAFALHPAFRASLITRGGEGRTVFTTAEGRTVGAVAIGTSLPIGRTVAEGSSLLAVAE